MWIFKSKPLPTTFETEKYFVKFQEGDRVLYMGRPAKVIRTDGANFWNDDDNEIPTLTVAYQDDSGRIHRDHLYPADVLHMLKPAMEVA